MLLSRLLTIVSALTFVTGQDPVGSTGCSAPACVFSNAYLRFGTGLETSVNNWGLFVQPWYYSRIANTWYKLTYNNYPLDTAVGTGITGTNWIGNTVVDLYTQIPSNIITDYSGFIVHTSDTTKSVGHGKIVATRTFSIIGQPVILTNTFSLGANDSFVKIITKVTNNATTSVNNMNVWVGTRDDFVGTTDSNTKTRGNLATGTFVPVTLSNQSSRAIMITNPTEGVLFYSETPNVMTAYSSCCAFSNAYNTNPLLLAPSTPSPNDGSYAAVLPIGTIFPGMSSSITWYYAAGAINSLASVAESVSISQQIDSGAASNSSTNSASPTPTKTSSVTPSETPSNTATKTSSDTPSNTPTRTQSSTPTRTSSSSDTPSNTPTRTQSSTPTRTSSSSDTPSNTPTRTQSSTPTRTSSSSDTPTNTLTRTPSISPTATFTPPQTTSETISATPVTSTTSTFINPFPTFIRDTIILNTTEIRITNTETVTNMLVFLYFLIPVNIILLCVCCSILCVCVRNQRISKSNIPQTREERVPHLQVREAAW